MSAISILPPICGPWVVSSDSLRGTYPIASRAGVLQEVNIALTRGDRLIAICWGTPSEIFADVCGKCFEPHHLCCCSHEN